MPSGGPLLEIPAQYPFGNWGAPHFSVCATVGKNVCFNENSRFVGITISYIKFTEA